MKKINLFALITVFLLASCGKNRQVTELIPIYIDVSNVEEFIDIADDVESEWEIIPLETNDNSIVSLIKRIIFQNDKYYILDYQSTIHVFDSNGKYLNKLDRRGQGPGEYIKITSFTVVGEDVWISDTERRRLIVYDRDFNFIKEINNLSISAFDINNIGQNIYMASNYSGDFDVNCQVQEYVIPDNRFTCLMKKANIQTSPIQYCQLTPYGDSCLFFQSYCDTIFQIKDNAITPKYRFFFSKRYIDIPYTSMEQYDNKPTDEIHGIIEVKRTANSVIICYVDNMRFIMAIYSEKTGKTRVSQLLRHSGLGGMIVSPNVFTSDGEIICYYNPDVFTEPEYYKDFLDEKKFKNPADLQKLKSVASKMKMEDNPFIIKFKLKDNSTF